MDEVKSVVYPAKTFTFLGFVLDSENMCILLTERKSVTTEISCKTLILKKSPSIREVSQVLGKLVSSSPGTLYGQLHYRHLEWDKIDALRSNNNDYDTLMGLSQKAKEDPTWRSANIESKQTRNSLTRTQPNVILSSDASLAGWGAECNGITTGGHWTRQELKKHINVLELMAGYTALRSLCKDLKHVHLNMDNTTAVLYINNMGGIQSRACNDVAQDMWSCCTHRHIWLSLSDTYQAN